MFVGQVVGPGGAQIHDYEPGIAANGLFWTVPVSPSTFRYNVATGEAVFRMRNYTIPDYQNFPSAISPAHPSVPGKVTFEIRWHGGRKVETATDGSTFRYRYRAGRTTAQWNGETPSESFRFESGTHAESSSLFGAVGEEWNGRFFKA